MSIKLLCCSKNQKITPFPFKSLLLLFSWKGGEWGMTLTIKDDKNRVFGLWEESAEQSPT